MTDRRTLREFLLGGLDPKDAEDMEERMFADDALFQQLDEEREALIEEYVAKSLTSEDSARFERQRSLSPELTGEVAEVRDWKTLLARKREERMADRAATRSFLRPLPLAMAVCLFSLAVSFCLQWRENRHLQAEVAQTAEVPQAGVKAIPVQDIGSQGVVFLAAGVVRGPQDVVRVEIAPDTSVVQLQVEIPSSEPDAKNWTLVVSRDGQETLRCDPVLARRVGSISYLPVYIAAESLPEGTYSVRIRSKDGSQSEESRTFKIGRALNLGTKPHSSTK